jgi:hypothetical protein
MHALACDCQKRKIYAKQQGQRIRARRCSQDPARRQWYALWRSIRFAKLDVHNVDCSELLRKSGWA